jgi:hypothetical protein
MRAALSATGGDSVAPRVIASVSAVRAETPGLDETTRLGRHVRTLASLGRSGSAVALPLVVAGFDQSRSPALADIIGARRMWTVAMISSGSSPCR